MPQQLKPTANGLTFDLVDDGGGDLDLVAVGNGLVLETDITFGADPLPPADGSRLIARGGGLRFTYNEVDPAPAAGGLFGTFEADGQGLRWDIFNTTPKTIVAQGGGYRAEIITV